MTYMNRTIIVERDSRELTTRVIDALNADAKRQYASRADAEASNVPESVDLINVLAGAIPEKDVITLRYIVDAGGTALTTNGGARSWSPVGDVYPDHFAVNSDPGVTPVQDAINAAIQFVSRRRATNSPPPTADEYGAVVHLRAVGHKVEGPVIIDADGVTIRGRGRSSYISRDDSDFDTISINRAGMTLPNGGLIYDVTVEDVALLAPIKMTGAFGRSHIFNVAARYLNLQRIYMSNPFIGVTTLGGGDFTFEDIDVEYDPAQYGLVGEAGSAGFVFDRNGEGGINYSSGEGSGKVSRARVWANGNPGSVSPNEHSFWIKAADGIWFTNCYGRGGYLSGWKVEAKDAESRTTGIKLNGCWVDWSFGISYDFGAAGFDSNNRQHQIVDCRAYGGSGPQTENHLRLIDAQNVSVSGNVFIEASGYSVRVEGENTTGVSLTGNVLRGVTKSSDIGVILIEDGAHDVIVTSNALGGTTDGETALTNFGVVLASTAGAGNTVSNNDCSNCVVDAVGNSSVLPQNIGHNSGQRKLLPGAGPSIAPVGGTLTVTHEKHEIDNTGLSVSTLSVSSIVNNGSGKVRITFLAPHGAVVGDVFDPNASTGVAGYDVRHIATTIVSATTIDTQVDYLSDVGAVGSFDRSPNLVHRIYGGFTQDEVTLYQADGNPDITFLNNDSAAYPNDRLRTGNADRSLLTSYGTIRFLKKLHQTNGGGNWAMTFYDDDVLS